MTAVLPETDTAARLAALEDRLALVDLQTGKATLRAGAFPARYPVTDLAIRIGR